MSCCPSRNVDASGVWTTSVRKSWEGTPRPSPKVWTASAGLSALAAVGLGIAVDRFPDARAFFVEDGPVEMAQALLLLGTAALFAAAFLRSAGSRALFCLLAAYACIFAMTREIPRCGSAFVGGDMCLDADWKTSIVVGISALALLALLIRPVDLRAALRLSNLRWTWPGLVVVGLLVLAEGLEHLIYYSEIEEFLELVAYLHLCAMALGILKRTSPG